MGVSSFHRMLPVAGAGAIVVAMLAVLPATATPARVRTGAALQLTVSPKESAFDTPLTISISGVKPGQRVTLSVTSVDATGVKWSSSSTYVASQSGAVNPATSPAVPALGGSYFGLDPMGPVDFMTTSAANSRFWWWAPKNTTNAFVPLKGSWSKPLSFVFSATSGQAHASVTVARGPVLPVTASSESVAADGFCGEFWQPSAAQNNHVAILLFGGSEGGIEADAALFASRGYPTLNIAYFDAPGLPQQLKDIPLEYFAKALRWLARQQGVDPKRIWVMGWSAGSEAALLAGIHYPNLVHGVAVFSPSDVASCNYNPPTSLNCDGPWWTFEGRPVPYTTQWANPHPTDNPAAVMPVAKIHGPVFLDCGGDDQAWDSCPSSETIMSELAAAHDAYPHELLKYPDAGHGISYPAPYWPGWYTYLGLNLLIGVDMESNPVALANQWPKLLAFLHN